MSAGCLNDVATIHTNGNTMATPRTVSAMYSSNCSQDAPRRACAASESLTEACSVPALVLIAPRQQSELNQSYAQDQHEQHYRHRRRVTHLVRAPKCLLIYVQDQAERAVQRTARALRGHVLDLRKNLQRADRAGHGHEHQRGVEQWQGDVAEGGPAAGAVEACCFVVDLGDGLQARQEDNNLKAQVVPHVD